MMPPLPDQHFSLPQRVEDLAEHLDYQRALEKQGRLLAAGQLSDETGVENGVSPAAKPALGMFQPGDLVIPTPVQPSAALGIRISR